MSMLRHRRLTAPDLPMRLLYSARTRAEVIYADELGDDAIVALTRELEGVPIEGLARFQLGRIFPGLIAAEAFDSGLAFVCGSNPFVESISQMLLAAGYAPRPDPHRALRPDRDLGSEGAGRRAVARNSRYTRVSRHGTGPHPRSSFA